jgi:hypothetical protein
MRIFFSERWVAWSERMQKCGHPPNLGSGGTIVAAFVTSFFAAHIGDAIFVIFAYGPRAFFIEGLRVADWKHGILSTGVQIPLGIDVIRGLLSFAFWVALIFLSEFCAGLLATFLMHRPRWMSSLTRILGGLLLFAFVVGFCRVDGSLIVFHPIPIAATIGGCVLIWRGAKALSRSGADSPR